MLKLCNMSSNRKAYLMAVKLFVLGLPGSGKSSVSRHITAYTQHKGWEISHFSDHIILEQMFLADIKHKQFKPADHGGFDVIDFTVCDIALQRLEQEINQHLVSAKSNKLIVIEFSRNDYRWAFQQFSDQFLLDAYFLYLKVDLEICKKRIRERITHPSTEDDFFVSENIFKSYYNKDDGQSIQQVLTEVYGIDIQRVMIIDNNESLSESMAQVHQFVDAMCGSERL